MRRRPALPLVLALALSSLVAPTAMAAPVAPVAPEPLPAAVEAKDTRTTVTVVFGGRLPHYGGIAAPVRLSSTPGSTHYSREAYLPVTGTSAGLVTFWNVPPGTYVLEAMRGASNVDIPSGWIAQDGSWVFNDAGQAPIITVGDAPTTIGPVSLPAGGSVTGRFIDGAGTRSWAPPMLLRPVGTSSYRWNYSVDDQDEQILVRGLGPTSYRVSLNFHNQVWHLVPSRTGPRISPVPGEPLVAARSGETIDLGTIVVPQVFPDVGVSQEHAPAIMWMREAGITTGFGDGTYRSLDVVRRDAMAAFLYRAAGRPDFTAPARSPFTDIRPEDMFYKEMAWLASTGISRGWSDGTFRPLTPVNRDAMAAFLYRYIDLTGTYDGTTDDPATFVAPATPVFTDVGVDDQFYEEMSWVFSVGIASGWEYTYYRPVTPIARDAIAAFLFRALEPEAQRWYRSEADSGPATIDVGEHIADHVDR